MSGTTPISPSLVDGLSKPWPETSSRQQAQFEQSLAQVASAHEVAASVPDRAMLVAPTSEVHRATSDANPLGERILQALSAMHLSNPAPSASVVSRAFLTKSVQPAAEQSLLQPNGAATHGAGKPNETDNFDAMLANLRDVYSNVIQVSLVSKSTSSVGSSLNKLLSAG